jgi:hypothetical protein
MSSPPRRIRPLAGVSVPARRLMSVLFPAPFGPMSACRAPSGSFS